MMYEISNDWGLWHMMNAFGGTIMMLLFWGAIIYFIVWLIKNNKSDKSENNRALHILEERYAKGEIDKKEFEEKKKDLMY